MKTCIAYFDESGDDGVTCSSSSYFILTSIYMSTENWQSNYNKIKSMRRYIKDKFGFPIKEEMHTKAFLTDKNPYRSYSLSDLNKQEILKTYALTLADMDLKIINVIIDKTKFVDDKYRVLENALKYNIQRIENDSNDEWNYIIITDTGRIAPMRKTARQIRLYNPIQSKYSHGFRNQPITKLIEDILEKNSSESYFIQMCDYVSYFVHLYFKLCFKNESLPNRVGKLIDRKFVGSVLATLRESQKLNLAACNSNKNGFVIYPK